MSDKQKTDQLLFEETALLEMEKKYQIMEELIISLTKPMPEGLGYHVLTACSKDIITGTIDCPILTLLIIWDGAKQVQFNMTG
jgi:hypothetical protein